MMAAIRAGGICPDVTLIEKNSSPGRKLLLSGKGRCNLTNLCDLDSFLKRFSKNGEFLRDAFKKFFNLELMRFFQERGLKLKTERQMRVFPESGISASILEVLEKELKNSHVKVRYDTSLKGISLEDKAVSGVSLADGGYLPCERIILATGGVSYKFTGSTGEALDIVRRLGHHIMPLRPGLVPLEIKENYPKDLEGLTLKNIRLKFSDSHKQIISDIGELLFTASGVSGPLVLSLSGKIIDWLKETKGMFVEIDLKPALFYEQLDSRFLREFKAAPRKAIKNILRDFLPLRLADVFIAIAGIAPEKKASHITQKERRVLIMLLKGLRLHIRGAQGIDKGMVTRGGVALAEINPRTMESRLIKGLYFAGEMIDIDADTGGFNLQAAFSTGYLAGESAALN